MKFCKQSISNLKKSFPQFAMLILLSCVGLSVSAKDGYKLKFTIKDNTDSLIYLCNYFGNTKSVYKIDSVHLQPGISTQTLFSTKAITGGIYILLFADRKMQFEIVLDNGDDIEFNFSKMNPLDNSFKNSKNNTDFYRYQKLASESGKKVNEIQNGLKTAKTKSDTLAIENEQRKIGRSLANYRDDYSAKNPNGFLATLFKALKEPEIPDSILSLKDVRIKDSLRFVYYKKHYWDYFDFKDDRILYAPILEAKLDQYYKMVPSVADSFIKEANYLMKHAEGSKDIYKYCFWWQTRNAGLSKVMGLDEAYAYMIENYVMRDKCPWLTDSNKQQYITDYKRISPNTIGKMAPEIELKNRKNVLSKLSTAVFANDYTVIAFYDPGCHHCQDEIPLMDSVIRKAVKDQKISIKIYGIRNSSEDNKWSEMIAKDKLMDDIWEHVYDPEKVNLGQYTAAYGVVVNPVFFVVDRQGKIVGKRVDHSNIAGLFEFLEKKKAK
jgi:peroxiredoxin